MPISPSIRRSARPVFAFLLLMAVLASAPASSEPSDATMSAPAALPRETTSSTRNGYTGMPVPPFTAATADGRRVTTSDPEALALIIDLWGLNCASCLEEMAALEPVYQEFRNSGLRIWSVNAEGITADRILAGLEKKGIKVSYDLVVDQDCSVTHLFTRWFIPVTVIVDRDGVVQYYKVGFNKNDIEKIRGKVAELVAP